MRKLFRGLLVTAAVLVLLVGGVLATAWVKTERLLARRYDVTDPPLAIAHDPATIQRGAHLYAVLGCSECHGAGAIGKLAIDAGPLGKAIAPNLTPHAIGQRYDGDGLAAAIRHGVRADGTPLRFMPSGDFAHLSDADTADLVAYLQALPNSDNAPGTTYLTPLGRTMALFGQIELTSAARIDHAPRLRVAPAATASADYGAYLLHSCTGCHGANLAGQHVAGTPPELPDAANLTPHPDGLQRWQFADAPAEVCASLICSIIPLRQSSIGISPFASC
ncbi:MAG: c-type cytochrome [Thermomonas sp.]